MSLNPHDHILKVATSSITDRLSLLSISSIEPLHLRGRQITIAIMKLHIPISAVFAIYFTSFTSGLLKTHVCKIQNPTRGCYKLSVATSTEEVAATTKNELFQELIQEIRKVGQVGSKATEEERKNIETLANKITPLTDGKPARKELTGKHELLYSAAPGGSSGAIGPFVGKVSQLFVNENIFKNIVNLGPLEVKLTAERKVLDDSRIRVKFIETRVKLFSVEVLNKETKGQGVWQTLFSGVINDNDGNPMLLRIMKTPSLFIIKQKL